MKNFFKLSYLLLAMPIIAVSCDDSDSYEPAPKPEGAQVYFSTNNSTSKTLTVTESSFTVDINRIDKTSSVSVPLSVTGDVDYFTVPSSVSFNSGEETAKIVITYDADQLGFDNKKAVTIAISDESLTTIYGQKAITVEGMIPAPWKTLGKCILNENWWNGTSQTLTIQQNEITPNVYRVVNPFSEAADYLQGAEYLEFTIYKPGETLYDNVLEQDIVWYDKIGMTYYENYDAVINLMFPGRFTSMPTQDKWIHNTVLAYQENGMPGLVQLAPYFYMDGVGGWNKTQNDDIITIVFPGYELKDYSSTIVYSGKFYDTEDNVFAVANIELGADVDAAKAIIVAEADVDAAVEGLADGSIEGTEVVAGANNIALPENAGTGKYSIVVVTFDGEGAAQEYEVNTFKYVNLSAPAANWDLTKPMVGDYEYTQYFEGTDSGLTLTPNGDGTFTISNIFYGVDFTFTLNEDNTISFAEQFSGYTHSTYGDVMVGDLSADPEDEDYAVGYYAPAEGTFYFQVYYGVEAGWFGAGLETFTISGYNEAAATRAMKIAPATKSIDNKTSVRRSLRLADRFDSNIAPKNVK